MSGQWQRTYRACPGSFAIVQGRYGIAYWIGFKLFPVWLVVRFLHLGQSGDVVALKTSMQGGTCQVRNKRLERVKAIIQRPKLYWRKATIMASSSTDETVERGFLGSVFKSSVLFLLRHLSTVFGLMPKCFNSLDPSSLDYPVLLNELPPSSWHCHVVAVP